MGVEQPNTSKAEAIKRMGDMMPDTNELSEGSPEQKSEFTLDDLKRKYPNYKKVVDASDHNDIVSICRSKILKANKEQADNYNAEEIKRAEKEGRKPKLIKPEPVKPADSTTHVETVYKPQGDQIEITHYAYGVGTNGESLMLIGQVEKRKATAAEKQAMGIETEDNAEALRWAEAGITSPEPLEEAEGQRIYNAIVKAGGARIQKNEDNIVYSRADLKTVDINVSYGAFYAVQLSGKKYFYKGRSVKG